MRWAEKATMQKVTYNCDGCGKQIEPVPEHSGGVGWVEHATPHAFFRVGAARAVVSAQTRAAGVGVIRARNASDSGYVATHAVQQLDQGTSFDLCRNCAESKTLLQLLG